MLPISVSVKHTEGFCSCVGNPGNRAHGQSPFFILQENNMNNYQDPLNDFIKYSSDESNSSVINEIAQDISRYGELKLKVSMYKTYNFLRKDISRIITKYVTTEVPAKRLWVDAYVCFGEMHGLDLFECKSNSGLQSVLQFLYASEMIRDFREYLTTVYFEGEKSNVHYIYFIRNIRTNNVKIGRSNNPEFRLRTLQTGNDSEMELMGYIEKCDKTYEKQLQKMFKEYHVRGEWYMLSHALKMFIEKNATILEDK